MKLRHATALGFVVIVARLGARSCDAVYGVSHAAAIDSMPLPDCVSKAISSAPGVTSVEYHETVGDRPITWSGVQRPDVVHTFSYKGATDSHVVGVLVITQEYDGRGQFSQYLTKINIVPSQEDIDATRPVMRYIERALDSQCGMSALSSQVSESSLGVQCSP